MITTALCKRAIVDSVITNVESLSNEFDPPASMVEATKEKNWKRTSKNSLGDGKTLREFDCKPYDDQLRTEVVDDGENIISVDVRGE